FALADQKERIACSNLAETDKRRGWIEVACFHHPHRSTPRNVDRSVEQTGGGGGRRRRVEQIYDDALAGIETEHVRGVEWRIKQSTKVFREPDPHRGNLVYRHAGRVTLHEFLQIVRRATIGRDLISADLLNAHLNDWGVYGRDSGRVEFLDERRRRVRMPDPAAFSACRPEASLLRRCLEDRR